MKRLYACIVIAAAVLALSVCGGRLVRQFSREMEAGLSAVEQAAARQDAAAAAQAAEGCLGQFEAQMRPLSFFVRQDELTQIAETLCAIPCYARAAQWEETLAACACARSRSRNLCRLFFRLL